MALFEEIGQLLAAPSAAQAASSAVGADSGTTQKALSSAVPLLLGSLGKRAGTQGGAGALFDMVQGQDGGLLDNIGGVFSGGDANGAGGLMVDGLLGSRKQGALAGLAEHSGMNLGSITKLLPLLAPVVMSFLGKRQTDRGLDQQAMMSELGNERVAMESAGFGSILGLLDGGTDEDERGFASNLTKIAGLGGIGALAAPAVASRIGGASSAVSGTAAKGAAAAGGARRVAAPATQVNREKPKPGWLKWLPLLLLGLLGLFVWGCIAATGGDEDDSASTTTAEVDTTAAGEVEDTEATEAEATEAEDTEAEEPETEEAEAEAPAAAGWIPGNILDAGDQTGNVGEFLGAVEAAGLSDTLEADGPLTIFSPSDEAMATVPDSIKNDPELLERVLSYHVVEGNLTAADLADGQLTSLEGDELNIVVGDNGPTVNGANVTTADIAGANGTLHIIDTVLLPPDVVASQGGSLNDALGLAPINFETSSAVITAEGQAVLDGAVEFLLANEGPVEIAGHTDSDGDDAFNLQLSQDRADAVMAYLIEKGVKAENLTAVGYGETQPVADNDTDEGKAKNRRIEFVAS